MWAKTNSWRHGSGKVRPPPPPISSVRDRWEWPATHPYSLPMRRNGAWQGMAMAMSKRWSRRSARYSPPNSSLQVRTLERRQQCLLSPYRLLVKEPRPIAIQYPPRRTPPSSRASVRLLDVFNEPLEPTYVGIEEGDLDIGAGSVFPTAHPQTSAAAVKSRSCPEEPCRRRLRWGGAISAHREAHSILRRAKRSGHQRTTWHRCSTIAECQLSRHDIGSLEQDGC